MTVLSNTTYPVTYNTMKAPMTRVKEAQFGDGYRQIIVDGINYDNETWNVDFVPFSQSKTNTLETLLLNSVNGEDNYLYWQGPGESTSKYYTAHSISKFPVGPDLWKIQCTFRREFVLA